MGVIQGEREMRLPGAGSGLLLAGLVGEAHESGGRPAAADSLLGAWSATRWQYTSAARAARSVDVVCDLGGAVTLSLGDGTWVLTHVARGRASRSVGGTFEHREGLLELRAGAAGEAEMVSFNLAADTLTIRNENATWDFDGHGLEEPASLVAVFVRL
jgi:hypothetical protein